MKNNDRKNAQKVPVRSGTAAKGAQKSNTSKKTVAGEAPFYKTKKGVVTIVLASLLISDGM